MSYENLLNRFLTYVKINTRSNPDSTTTPSTQTQVDFALNVLKPEMESVGLQDVHYLTNGYLVGTLPANDSTKTRKIGFIAHMDTIWLCTFTRRVSKFEQLPWTNFGNN